ncbi:hypothetical protein T02_3104 [Trichinella nativa]|uniref:Uncharacterized protein n=1 Tax=Trichinella nativa TaxID=6335 RepID=A0A0V1KI97_9BILA|nr:hypothetical protein T02_3104 [Trichinella nativa]
MDCSVEVKVSMRRTSTLSGVLEKTCKFQNFRKYQRQCPGGSLRG